MISSEEKVGAISQPEKGVNELLAHSVMLYSLIVVYVHFWIMLIEVRKVLSQELKCLFGWQDYRSSFGMNHTKNCVCVSLFYCIRNK
jgi:hypothetical protein